MNKSNWCEIWPRPQVTAPVRQKEIISRGKDDQKGAFSVVFLLIFVRKFVIICTKYGGNDFRLEREARGGPHVFVSADTRQNPFSGRKAKVLNLGHLYFDIVSTVRCPVEVLELRISYFSYRDTLHASRDTSLPSTSVENPLQISSFMQNKANFQKSQVNVKSAMIVR